MQETGNMEIDTSRTMVSENAVNVSPMLIIGLLIMSALSADHVIIMPGHMKRWLMGERLMWATGYTTTRLMCRMRMLAS